MTPVGSGNTPVTAFRLARELLERVDRYAEQLAAQARVPVSRNAAVVRLLTDALDAAEVERTKRPAEPKRRARGTRRDKD
jgi:hypothetical protein